MAPFISCDWGTTSLRVRWVEGEPFRIAAEARLDRGVARVREEIGNDAAGGGERFRAVLAVALGKLAEMAGKDFPRRAPVLISGMASSSIGWRELPYAVLPFPLDGSGVRWEEAGEVRHERGEHRAFLISGLRSPSDVLRGEETEALGLLSADGFALDSLRKGVFLVLPGTHSKHIQVEDGSIVGFATYMTGELFSVLSEHGILKHSVLKPEKPGGSFEDDPAGAETFREGILHARSRALPGALFAVRTNELLRGMDPRRNGWFLSGLLIGTEVLDLLHFADRSHPRVPILLAAAAGLSRPYGAAFEALGGGGRFQALPPALVESAAARGHLLLLGRICQGVDA